MAPFPALRLSFAVAAPFPRAYLRTSDRSGMAAIMVAAAGGLSDPKRVRVRCICEQPSQFLTATSRSESQKTLQLVRVACVAPDPFFLSFFLSSGNCS
jgi:hypothetical protein